MRQLNALHTTRSPRGLCRSWTLPLLCAGAAVTWSGAAFAQTTASAYFPTGTYGYDQDLGVTVLSRARPLYEEQGVRLGSFTIRPDIDQSIFNNSNVNGTNGPSSASSGLETDGSLSAASDWLRNSLDATVGFDRYQFFALPQQNYTNWNIGLGGGYTIGDHELTAAYAHSTTNQLGTTIGLARSETPALDTTDSAELGYTIDLGRFSFMPTLAFSAYRFGNITSGNVQESQASLNRNVIAAGVITRYAMTGSAGLLLVARVLSSHFIQPLPDTPSNDSTSALFLAGLDYQAESVWRYDLLVGVERQSFTAAQYGAVTTPILSASVVYTPTGVMTITGSVTRLIEDASASGNDGFVLSQGSLVLDYELTRNVLLEATGGFQNAAYLQGGSQNNETVGGSATWLLNQYMRLVLSDNFTNQTAPSGTVGAQASSSLTNVSGAYTQNVVMLTLHLGL